MKRLLLSIVWLGIAMPARSATDAVLVGQSDPSPMPQYVGVWGWTNPATNRKYAFLGNNATGMYVVDATDPTNPVPVGTPITSVPRVDMKTYQHYLYSCDGLANGVGGILDIANPASPVLVGSFSGGHNLFVDGKGFLYVVLPGFRIYDLKPDPTHPALVYNLNVPEGHDVTVIGDRMYEFRSTAGTFIWNVTNRSAPVQIGSIIDPTMTFYHNGWPTRDAGYLFITDEYATTPKPDITVWDIHNVASPFKVASIYDATASAHNCYVVGSLLAVAYYTAGLKLYDVSNPVTPVLVDSYDTSSYTGEGNFDGAWACYAYAPGNHLYISDRPNGLFIFELTGPTAVRPGAPPALTLSASMPNPFGRDTRMTYTLARGSDVTAAVYNVKGDRVKLLESGWRESGVRDLSWDGIDEHGRTAASGMYYIRVQTQSGTLSRKITLLR
jgi:choice-of-anchor B domain-containing protein